MMKAGRFLLVGACWLLPVLLAPAPGAVDQKKSPPPLAITKLAWLAGNWRMEKGGRVIDEQWMAPAAGVMLGMVRTIAKGRVVEHEFVQIREGPGGDLFYVSQPSGQKEATFQVAFLTSTTAVFENAQQDFPQKISYTLQPGGSLLAVNEGTGPDGQLKRVEFNFQRAQQ